MANPTGKGGHRFKKGESGNPGGRKRPDQHIVAFKETTYKDFIMQMQRYGSMTKDEMQADLKRPDATMFELMFGNIVVSATRGDKDARAVLLDRLWGKVKEAPPSLLPDNAVNAGPQIIIELPAKNVE